MGLLSLVRPLVSIVSSSNGKFTSCTSILKSVNLYLLNSLLPALYIYYVMIIICITYYIYYYVQHVHDCTKYYKLKLLYNKTYVLTNIHIEYSRRWKKRRAGMWVQISSRYVWPDNMPIKYMPGHWKTLQIK